MKYVLFGAGDYGKAAMNLLGKEKVKFFLDNDKQKDLTYKEDVLVRYFPDVAKELEGETVLITVSTKYEDQIEEQLKNAGVSNYMRFSTLRKELILEKINNRPNYIAIYDKAKNWILSHTVKDKGIINNTVDDMSYPEVSGYYIPTLLQWGFRDLAVQYAKWLCAIQKPDGSWFDTFDKDAYIFDSAQILKGLLAIRGILPEVDPHIIAGCEWIFSRMSKDGRLLTPSTEAWSSNKNMCDEVIHIYCLSPLIEAGRAFNKPEYEKKAKKIWSYYKNAYYAKIMNFSLLSHFYAYLMEALIDIGEMDMARAAMEKMKSYQRDTGAVPAYHNCHWICSTGLFQLSMVWFRLGERECGNKAFEYACKLQNPSGGWYGSYISEDYPDEDCDYFPAMEISWAVKYFLDALYAKLETEFNLQAPTFIGKYSLTDGRYKKIETLVNKKAKDTSLNVLDVGCGKGAYLKNLILRVPGAKYYAVDLSENVLEFVNDPCIVTKKGSLTNIPYPDNFFDIVYTCEALEHAIDVDYSIKEMCRVTKPGGTVAVIDKSSKALGTLEIEDWEQWLDEDMLKSILSQYCRDVDVDTNINCETMCSDMFCMWSGTVV